MRILFDQGTPAPLRRELVGHDVVLAHERGWSTLTNGELLAAAEREFDLLITTDQRLQYQQNLAGRRIAILVLNTTNWPRIQRHASLVLEAAASMQAGEFRELKIPD